MVRDHESYFSCFATRPAFVQTDGSVYYMCKCNECNYEDILTVDEMLAHSVEHANKTE